MSNKAPEIRIHFVWPRCESCKEIMIYGPLGTAPMSSYPTGKCYDCLGSEPKPEPEPEPCLVEVDV